ncbi:MAG: NUDIX domain-containing protein, partial [Kiloniellales bacterium]
APRCALCPLEAGCLARAAGVAETLPRRQPKAERPTRRAVAFLLSDKAGRLLLRRRPAEGLLGAMMEVPSTPWRGAHWNPAAARRHAPAAAPWQPLPGKVVHVFTHFRLEVEVWAAPLTRKVVPEGRWVALESLAGEALPSVMRKVIAHGLEASARS